MQEILNQIERAAKQTLKRANITAKVSIIPTALIFEEIASEADAKRLEAAFLNQGMTSLGTCDDNEIGMGPGWSLTIAI